MSDELSLSPAKAYDTIVDLFGGEENVFLNPNQLVKKEVVRSPSPALDRALGVGGWPRGTMIQLAGKESSGKTLIALASCAEWQKLDPENCCVFIDAEYTYAPKWAAKLGVDNSRMLLVKTNEGAKIFEGLVGTKKVNKNSGEVSTAKPGIFEMVIAKQIIEAKDANGIKQKMNLGKLGVIVLDSIAAVNTPTDISSDVGKQNMALMARFLSVELKKLTPMIAMSNTIMFIINQVRINIGQMYGDPTSSPGGKALKHACSVMVEFAPIENAASAYLDANEEKIGHHVRAKIGKNKVASPFKQAEYGIKYLHGVVEKEVELLDIGEKVGAIERPNNRTYVIGETKLTSREHALAYVREHMELVDKFVRDHYLSASTDDAEFAPEAHHIESPFEEEE